MSVPLTRAVVRAIRLGVQMREASLLPVKGAVAALVIALLAVPFSGRTQAAPKESGPNLAIAPVAPKDWQDSVGGSKGVTVEAWTPTAATVGTKSCLPDWVVGGTEVPVDLTIMGVKAKVLTVWIQSYGNGSRASRGNWRKFEVIPEGKFSRDFSVTVRPNAVDHETRVFIRVNDNKGQWAETSFRVKVKAQCPDCAPGIPVTEFIPDFDPDGNPMSLPESLSDLPDLPYRSTVLDRPDVGSPYFDGSEFALAIYLPDGVVPEKFLCRYYLRLLASGWQTKQPPAFWRPDEPGQVILRRSPWWLSITEATIEGRPAFGIHGCQYCR